MVVPRVITIYEEGCNETTDTYINLTYKLKNGIVLQTLGNCIDEVHDLAQNELNNLYEIELISFIIESPHITKDYLNVDKCLEGYIMLSVGFRNEIRSDYNENVDETIDDLIGDVINFYDVNDIKGLRNGEEFITGSLREAEFGVDDYEWLMDDDEEWI